MGKIEEFVKKHDNIVMVSIISLISFTFAFVLKFNADDTLWNFSNIYKMSNGYQIYNDLNVIITPLFFYIGKVIFQIFPKNYITYNIYQNIVIYIPLFSMCYVLMKKMKIRKLDAMIFTTIAAIITMAIMPEASYNMLAILFVILGIYNIIRNMDSSKNRHVFNILQGIICFLVFASKQNTGAYFVIGMSIAQLIITKSKKKAILNIIEQGIVAIILTATLLLYMNQNNYLNGFMNFAFSGIGEFSGSNFKFALDGLMYVLISVFFTIVCFIITFLKIPLKENEKMIIRVLSVFSIFMNMIAYPIINTAHALIGNITFMILISYMIELLIFRELISGKKVEKIKKITLITTIAIMSIICIINNTGYIIKINRNDYCFEKDSIYYGANAEKTTVDAINEVCKYIKEENEKGYEVKIISCYANLYMNLFNKNNGIMDLPFYGNLGKEGVEGLKKQIDDLTKTKILIAEDSDYRHLQEPESIKEHIQNNFEKEGEIQQFSIYKSKK